MAFAAGQPIANYLTGTNTSSSLPNVNAPLPAPWFKLNPLTVTGNGDNKGSTINTSTGTSSASQFVFNNYTSQTFYVYVSNQLGQPTTLLTVLPSTPQQSYQSLSGSNQSGLFTDAQLYLYISSTSDPKNYQRYSQCPPYSPQGTNILYKSIQQAYQINNALSQNVVVILVLQAIQGVLLVR